MTQEYTAEQAKQEAIESNKKFLEQELAIIITTIKLAANEGIREIPINIATHKNTIVELRKRGFLVEVDEDRSEYIVSW